MADSTTPPGYASDPTLAILWGTPPAYTGNTGAATGAPGASAPEHNPFMVQLSSLQAAEQALLGAASTIISSYNPLEQQVQADIAGGTIFGQQATYSGTYINPLLNGDPHPQAGSNADHEFTDPDEQLNQAAITFAASMDPSMTRVLRMIADATESVGVFIALLDKAGQAYCAADKASVCPMPSTTATA